MILICIDCELHADHMWGPQAKDCVQLLHLWYAKAELGSRTIRNKSFEGVDVLELDLIDRD